MFIEVHVLYSLQITVPPSFLMILNIFLNRIVLMDNFFVGPRFPITPYNGILQYFGILYIYIYIYYK